jgi:DNA-binding NtrC family response regulator
MQKANELWSPNRTQTLILLRQATLDNRLDALRRIALTLLGEVELLRSTQPRGSNHDVKLQDQVQGFEADLIRCALARTHGNQSRAARLLRVKHSTLHAKIKRYGISFNGNGLVTKDDQKES